MVDRNDYRPDDASEDGNMDIRSGEPEERVLKFLAENEGETFTVSEISEATEIRREKVERILDRIA